MEIINKKIIGNISEIVHRDLMFLKIGLKLKSVDDVLKLLIRFYKNAGNSQILNSDSGNKLNNEII